MLLMLNRKWPQRNQMSTRTEPCVGTHSYYLYCCHNIKRLNLVEAHCAVQIYNNNCSCPKEPNIITKIANNQPRSMTGCRVFKSVFDALHFCMHAVIYNPLRSWKQVTWSKHRDVQATAFLPQRQQM